MNVDRFARGAAFAAGFLFLCAAPERARGQGNTPGPAPAAHKALPVARPQRLSSSWDDFAGLTYTDEQKARIDQIHQNMKLRKDAVVKDEKLSAEQRDAMLEGYARMGRGEVFKVLTTQQQKEVLKKARARRVAEEKRQFPPK